MPRKSSTSEEESKSEKNEGESSSSSEVEFIDEIGDVLVEQRSVAEILQNLPGVGPATAKRLEESGYVTLESIAISSVAEIVAVTDLGDAQVRSLIEAARDALQLDFVTADIIWERRKNISRITIGSKNLDELLAGGIETGGITELFGEFRTGKTQIAHQLCVTVQLEKDLGGLEGRAFYIDTEGTFRPERILQIAERFKVDKGEVLKNIFVSRAFNSDHQMALADQALPELREKNVRLLVVDSLTSHFRAEYIGRGTLAPRQQKLNKHIHQLLRAAEVYNLAVIVTNQVMAKPDAFFGDPTTPIGGHVVAHGCTTRLYLRKSKGEKRIARMIDSPLLPAGEAVFAILPQGITDG